MQKNQKHGLYSKSHDFEGPLEREITSANVFQIQLKY